MIKRSGYLRLAWSDFNGHLLDNNIIKKLFKELHWNISVTTMKGLAAGETGAAVDVVVGLGPRMVTLLRCLKEAELRAYYVQEALHGLTLIDVFVVEEIVRLRGMLVRKRQAHQLV